MTTQYPYYQDPRFAAPPAPDYLSNGNAQHQNQYQYQQQHQQFATSPHNGTYQQYAPPPAPSYINAAQPPAPQYSPQPIPQIQYPPQYQQPQWQTSQPSYTPQPTNAQNAYPPPPPSPQPYGNNITPQPTLSPAPSSLQPTYSNPVPSPSPSLPAVAAVTVQSQLQLQQSSEKVLLHLHFVSEDKGSMRNKYRHTYNWSLGPYTLAFTAPSTLSPSMGELLVSRVNEQVGRCQWFKSAGWHTTHIDFPFFSWPTCWDPDREQWASDAGTLDGNGLEWETTVNQEQQVAFRCLTVGEDSSGNAAGEKGMEICKVTVLNKEEECAVVELDGGIFGKGRCKEEQVDEIVTMAMIMVTRWSNGWRLTGGGGGGHSGATSEAVKLATESMDLASNILQIAGGGGS